MIRAPVALAGQRDHDAIVALLAAQYREHAIRLPARRLRAAIDGALADSRRGRFVVARDGDKVVGLAYLSFVWALEHGGRSAWLEELYVVPDCRGRGIGGRLLAAALAVAHRERCAAVDLEVIHGHERAARLYARNRFRPLPRMRWACQLSPGRSTPERT